MTNMPFVKLVTEIRGGKLEEHLSEKVRQVLQGMQEHGGKGKLVLTLDFVPNKYGQVEVKGKVKAEVPDRAIAPGIYWLDDDASLVSRDPSQRDIEDIPGVARMKN